MGIPVSFRFRGRSSPFAKRGGNKLLEKLFRILAFTLAVVASAVAQPTPTAQSVQIGFLSQGARVHGKFFPAPGPGLKPTLLMLPGWPGNPNDVANLGAGLPGFGVNMVMFNPRGMHASEGSFSFSNTLADIDAALAWLADGDVRRQFNIDPAKIALGGHSFGGGMAMVYAATHPSAPNRILGIAPADVGDTVNGLLNDPATQISMRKSFTIPGAMPVRIADIDGTFSQIKADGNRYWLHDAAPLLAGRSILLVGGWEDVVVTIDQTVLPFYRALKKGGTTDITFLTYHDGHQFVSVKERLSSDVSAWLKR
jgi:uncharacterized protein